MADERVDTALTLLEGLEDKPVAEHVERHTPTNDWSPPPVEQTFRPEPVERPAPPSFPATGGDSAPVAPNTDERGPN